jgi:uncharacterized protein
MSVSDLIEDPKALSADMEALMESSERLEEGLAHLSYTDGLMTAVIVSPELIPPSEWMPLISGVSEQHTDIKEAQLAVNLVMLQYNKIIETLGSKKKPYKPFFWEDTNKRLITRDWVEGFMFGVSLRREAWTRLLEGDHKPLLTALSILMQHDEDRAKMEENGFDPDEAFDAAREVAPKVIRALYECFGDNGREESQTVRREEPKTGRNDPCPCGSGKKYKKCCMS